MNIVFSEYIISPNVDFVKIIILQPRNGCRYKIPPGSASTSFPWGECGVKCLNSGGVIATVGSGGGDIHPLSSVKLLYHKIITDSIT